MRRTILWPPTIADLLFLIVLLRALQLGQTDLLNDPGTPWHIQVGADVWEDGPPRVDRYSFTRDGKPWLSQHWLFDAALVLLHRAWSWDGLVLGAALLLGWTYRLLFRTVLEAPANVAWAAGLTLLAAGCAAPNWLARPHLITLWFVLLTFRWCLQYHRSGSAYIWGVPPLMALWCNIHGGFLAGLVIVGCSLVGQLLSVPRNATWRKRCLGFGAVLIASAVATLVNPYGWDLHRHLGNLLFSSQVRDLIAEWRAPDFTSGESRPLELFVLLTVALLGLSRRLPDAFSLIHLVVWTHFGLTAVRQAALFGLIAAPVLGGWTEGLWQQVRKQFGLGSRWSWVETIGRRASDWAKEERAARWPLWSGIVTALLVLGMVAGVRVQASPDKWPSQAVEQLNAQPPKGTLFHRQEWGGYLILEAQPRRRVFIDDRFELYGREFVLRYLNALRYGPAWDQLLEQYQFRYVLIQPDDPLARVLCRSDQWELLHEDSAAVLLERRSRAP